MEFLFNLFKGQGPYPHRFQVIEDNLVFPSGRINTDSTLDDDPHSVFGEEFEIAGLFKCLIKGDIWCNV